MLSENQQITNWY